MQNTLKRFVRRLAFLSRITLYKSTKDKRELDRFMKRIRQLETMSDIEWSRMQELAKKELQIYGRSNKTNSTNASQYESADGSKSADYSRA